MGSARRLLHSLALLPVLGARHAWKAAESFREPRHCGITVRRRITGIIATACNCFAEACGYEAKLPLLFSDRDVLPQAIVSAGVSWGWRTITARS